MVVIVMDIDVKRGMRELYLSQFKIIEFNLYIRLLFLSVKIPVDFSMNSI